jgi:subtilisin family serine protease
MDQRIRNIIIFLLIIFVISSVTFTNAKKNEIEKKNKKIFLKSRIIDSNNFKVKSELTKQTQEVKTEKNKTYSIVQFDHIPSKSEKKELEKKGIKLLYYIPENAWIASIKKDAKTVQSVTGLNIIDEVRTYDKYSPGFFDELDFVCEDNCTISVEFFSDVKSEDIIDIINLYGKINSTGVGNSYIIKLPKSYIQNLIQEIEVKWIDIAYRKRSIMNNGARNASSVNIIQDSPYNLNGTGVVVAVWDEGWAEQTHYDLIGRVRRGDIGSSDMDHGTHVSGTLVGNGNNSNGVYKGIAPNATLLTFEWPDTSLELYGETNESLNNNSILSQNSWGTAITLGNGNCHLLGSYDSESEDYDEIVRGENVVKKINVIFSAGNSGSGAYGCTPGYNTTSAPGGTAKNTIVVGSVDSDDFEINDFSSRGPTDDGRIKPDLVAPGCEDEPNRDDNNPEKTIWSTITGNTYGGSCGTSMAAPVVSGVVALMHEHYRNLNGGADPDTSLVKNILLHSARDLGNNGPDYIYGWGLVNATAAINLISNDSTHNLFYLDNITANGDTKNYTFYVPSNSNELKITLVWNDYPGSASASKNLINDLDLVVTNSTGTRFYPWTLDKSNPSNNAVQTTVDSTNNVEQVYITNPNSGFYSVTVNGTTVPNPNQEFSLITNHNYTSDTTPPYFDPVPVNQIVEYASPFSYDVNATDLLLSIDNYFINDSDFSIDGNGLITNNSILSLKLYSLNVSCNDTNGNSNYTIFNVTVQDMTFPYFSSVSNQTSEYGIDFSYQVTGLDNYQIANYSINDSNNFKINNSGYLQNNTLLNLGVYMLNISINDTNGNRNNTIISVTVQDTTVPYFNPVPVNKVINYSQGFSYQIIAYDNLNVSSYIVNDTTNFVINSSGYLQNNTILLPKTYPINISCNDTSGNLNSTVFNVLVRINNEINISANTSTNIDLSKSDSNLIIYLLENVTSNILVHKHESLTKSGVTASLNSLKGINITADSATKGNMSWAMIKIYYNSTEISSSNANIDESTMSIYYFNETSSSWQIESSSIDTTNKFVYSNVSHFSLFAVFGSAPTTPTPTTSGGGGGGGGSSSVTHEVSLVESEIAYTKLNRNDKIKFSSVDYSHTMTIKRVGSTSVIFLLESDPIEFTLNVLEEKIIDLNKDEQLYVRLDTIKDRQVDIAIKKIILKKEIKQITKIPVKEIVENKSVEILNVTESEDNLSLVDLTKEVKKTNKITGILVSIIIVIIGLFLFRQLQFKRTMKGHSYYNHTHKHKKHHKKHKK